MALHAFEAQARYLDKLRGVTCTHARLGYSTMLLLDFGTRQPPDQEGYRHPDYGLVVECSWRLESRTEVLAGFFDEAEDIEAAIRTCVGRSVVRARSFPPSYMMRLNLSGGITLWDFSDRTGPYAADGDSRVPWYFAGRLVSGGWEG